MAVIAEASRGALVSYFDTILTPIIATIANTFVPVAGSPTTDKEAILDSGRRIVVSCNAEGVAEIVARAFELLADSKVSLRVAVIAMMEWLTKGVDADVYMEQLPHILVVLLRGLNDPAVEVMELAISGITALVAAVPETELDEHILLIQEEIHSLAFR